MAKINNIKKFRQRFVKDYNLPINIFDDNLFEYYIQLYDFFPYPRYKETIEKIENEYDGCVEKWLEYCASVRDNAINGVMETDEYKKFNSMDLSQYNFAPICGERSCYTEETNGRRFLSIDLRKANFQALKYAGVVSDATYEQFIHRFGGDDYIANSKYLRQVIFGKMNPSRQIKIEKYLMSKVYEVIKDVTEKYRFTIFSMNSDELIFAITEEFYNNRQEDENTRELINDIYNLVGKNIGVEIKVEYIEVRRLPIVSANGTKIDAYERTNLFTSQKTLKKASTTFYPQIYKLWNEMPIEDNDMIFYFENQLATFNQELRCV